MLKLRTMVISIEEMRISDLEQARVLWSNIPELSFSPEFDSTERLTRFLDRNPGLSTIARVEDSIIGAVLCGNDGRRGFIYHAGVEATFRKQGIAHKMVLRCFEMLRREHIDNCFLFTSKSNLCAQEFWQSMGFYNAPQIMYHSRSI